MRGDIKTTSMKRVDFRKFNIKFFHIILMVLIVVLWGIFFRWQSDIKILEASIREHIIRYDLIFLPINLGTTIGVIWAILKTDKH